MTFDVAKSLEVVATGARLGDGSRLNVLNGARVSIRDLEFVSAEQMAMNIDCQNTSGGSPSSVTLTRAYMRLTGGNGLNLSNCDLSLEDSRLEVDDMNVMVEAGASLDARRSSFRQISPGVATVSVHAEARELRLVNVLFDNVTLRFSTPNPAPASIRHFIAYSTLVSEVTPISFFPLAPSAAVVRVENAILVATEASDAAGCNHCVFVNTLAHPRGAIRPGVVAGDPLFVNVDDFALQAASPGVDAAILATPQLDAAEDLLRVPRPQGAAKDLGAYERPAP